MTKTTPRLFVALLTCLLLALPVAAKDIASVSVSAGELVFMSEAAVAGFQLTVTGPGGYVYTETFDGSGAMAWAAQAADGGVLANGAYSYELRPIAQPAKRGSAAGEKAELTALSGTVTVRGGSLVSPEEREEPLTKDQVIADDLIVTGSICVGFDCVNGENFGFDTIRLKENNTRIKFQDTSTGTFPSNDWQLTANDSASGGANRFSIDDIDGGRTPFTIEAGAPSHSLYVDDAGNLGLGTSTPVVEIHVKDGDSPALRLEQDGSSGFTAQTWDMAGNETNFFVRDVTNGSKLPFKIFPNAPTNSLTIEGTTGDIGVGTASPDAPVHVTRSSTGYSTNGLIHAASSAGETTLMRIENTNATARAVALELDNTAGSGWQFRLGGDGAFNINDNGVAGGAMTFAAGSGGVTGLITARGDFTVTGTFSNPSSRTLKTSIRPIDRSMILERLAELPINSWIYTADPAARRHIGPFTEDFGAAFGVGTMGKNIIPLDVQGVTIAAVQGLYQTVKEKDAQIKSLEERLAALEARIAGE